MGLRNLNKEIKIKNEKYIKCLILVVVTQFPLLLIFEFVDKFQYSEPWPWPYNIAVMIGKIILFTPVVIAYFKCSLHKEEINLKNWKQYIIGILLYLPMWLAAQPEYYKLFMADFSDYARYSGDVVWTFFYYFLFVAFVEEFTFRVYVQGELEVLLGKAKILAPLLAGILFGLSHIVHGDMGQVMMTSVMGILLGYAKYFIKDCTFISVVIAHGLYDYLLAWGWGIPFI